MALDIHAIASRFAIDAAFESSEPYGSGHINDTYRLTCCRNGKTQRYLLQRINHHVFPDVPALMSNIERVCHHIRRKHEEAGGPQAARRCLTLVPTTNGAAWTRDDEGDYWRMFQFIEGAVSHDIVQTPEQARTAAQAFGSFQQQLADLPGPRLHETIPDFHHTPKRVQTFEQALAQDTHRRAARARDEVNWVLEHRGLADALLDLHRRGLIPERITHNDTKLNNVLLDPDTHEAICVIDLDTVMPGLALFDFGDLVRTSTSPVAEDEPDTSKVMMQMPMFEALVRGYVAGAGRVLTPTEIDRLDMSGVVIAYTMGVRFLTDFLQGDVYYKTLHPNHNLDRCRTQIALVDSMLGQREAMRACVTRVMQGAIQP